MKMTIKEWVLDILGVILILLAFYKEFFTEAGMETKQFVIMIVLGGVMIAWTAKKMGSFGFSVLKKYFNKKS